MALGVAGLLSLGLAGPAAAQYAPAVSQPFDETASVVSSSVGPGPVDQYGTPYDAAMTDGVMTGVPITGPFHLQELRTHTPNGGMGDVNGQLTIQDGSGNGITITLNGSFTLAGDETTASGDFTIMNGTGAFVGATGQGSFSEASSGAGGESPTLSLTGSWLGVVGYQFVPPPIVTYFEVPLPYLLYPPITIPIAAPPTPVTVTVQGLNAATGQPFTVGTAPQANPALLLAPSLTASAPSAPTAVPAAATPVPVSSTNAATGTQMAVGSAPALDPLASQSSQTSVLPSNAVTYSNPPSSSTGASSSTSVASSGPSVSTTSSFASGSSFSSSASPSTYGSGSAATSSGASVYTPPAVTNYSNPTLPSNNAASNSTLRSALGK